MGNVSKGFSLFLLVVLAVSSLIVDESTKAQTPTLSPSPSPTASPTPSPTTSFIQTPTPTPAQTTPPIPKPSIPEFTVQFVDRSYDVPITYKTTTDPFTGEQITTSSGGYRVINRTIDVSIKNQPFASVDLKNGSVIDLYYSVRAKGHFGDWNDSRTDAGYYFMRVASLSADYTLVTLVFGVDGWSIPDGGKEDFQVKAQAGYLYPHYQGLVQTGTFFASFEESSWTNSKTLPIYYSNSITSNPTPFPSVPEFFWLTILPLLLAIPIVLIMIRNRLTGRSSNRTLILESNHKGCCRRIHKSRHTR